MADERPASEFEKAAADAAGNEESLIVEFWGFLKHNKKWWLLPIVIVLFCMGLLFVLSSTGVAPFIYTLF